MKTLTHPSIIKETMNMSFPLKVTMHVLGAARTDVRVMREATALAAAGGAVSIIDVESGGNLPVEEELEGISLKHIIMADSFSATRFTRWPLLRALQLLIRSVLRLVQIPTDIYHAHDVSALPACYVAARLRRKPLIFDAHELPLPEEITIRWRWVQMLVAWMLHHIVPRCAGVITVSPPIAQEIQKRYHIPEVVLLRNVPAYRTVLKSDRLRDYLQLDPGTRIVLFQGYLQAIRGLDRLIRAAKFLDDNIVLVLMGKDMGGAVSQLMSLAASEGVAERIKIVPAVPYAELLEWTSSADIGVIIYQPDSSLNFRMCLPNKFFEYLMAGLPILASPLDAISEVIRTYSVGQIVPSLAPADVGAAINTMLVDTVALAAMHHNALDAAQEEFNWEKESQQLTRLYSAILARRGAK
jgi:glycosyltransferase involved in cell wall biosynthesis